MAAESIVTDWDDTWDYESMGAWKEEGFMDTPFVQTAPTQRTIVEAAPSLKPSNFTSYAFWMPTTKPQVNVDGSIVERVVMDRFSFDGRRHMQRCYDTPARNLLLFCGRQVEKSTLLGNIMLSYMCLINGYRALYVSPSMTQTKTFSADRIKEPMETSPVLQKFTTTMYQRTERG